MRTSVSLITFLVVALFGLAACTHSYTLKGFDADPAQLKKSKTKKVAVVFEEPKFLQQYESSADGHTWQFVQTDIFYRQAYSSALRDSVESVEYFYEKPATGYDVYLYPKLQLDITSSFMTKTCKANYGLVAKDKKGRTIAEKEKSGEHNFSLVANAENACKIAMLRTFDEVTYGVLKTIDKK